MDNAFLLFRARAAARNLLAAGLLGLFAGCTSPWLTPGPALQQASIMHAHPLTGRVWDPRAAAFVAPDAAIARARDAHLLILGEAHDNPDHHRLQAVVLRALLAAGRRPALAMEQFDAGFQPALDVAHAAGVRDPERIATAGGFDREGWRWPDYRPLVALAADNGLELVAANLSREDARVLMRSGRPAPGLPAASLALRSALEEDIIEGHCGHRPSGNLLAGMVEAQRARDARMAAALGVRADSGAVLIAGAGHARRNRGAPLYLTKAQRAGLLSLAFIEVEEGRTDPRDYAGAMAPGVYDLVWFTPRAAREDPCKGLKMP